ncbi:MAG: M20/M25/M40 family metallo-hydrolase [Bacteroidales bacterium]|nr:M20/M25/M40 family metallo-hydrolase [Bacteroidales bacterium]
MRTIKIIVALAFLTQAVFAQQPFEFSEQAVIERLQKDIYTLASDSLEGREAGTIGERKAADYIKARMQEAGLKPLFGESYFQEVPFPGEFLAGQDNFLVIDGKEYEFEKDFFAMPNTGNASANAPSVYANFGLEGVEGIDNYKDLGSVAGKVVVLEYYSPEGLEEKLGINSRDALANKIELAIKKGAVGIVLVNSLSWRTDPRISLRMNVPREDIPVVFATSAIAEIIKAHSGIEIYMSTELEREMHTGINVAGYWDNNAPTTVIIGGHYDHLGFGGSGSRNPGERLIHPGADDNASGTAGVIEAARYLVNSDLKKHNYIFIAFTAEEKGLLGSRYFADSDAYDMKKANYMLNFDMLGRLNDYSLALIGTGTTPMWEDLIDRAAPEHFNIRKSSGGLGGSDHTAFYLKDIPVLFFFTGIHDDYHRPGDTPDKVNYKGTQEILSFAYDLMRLIENEDRLAFTPTQTTDTRRRRADGVTLGLMPDHAYEAQGLKIQAVIDDRPAQKAGIQNGDVIIRIDEEEIKEIQSYMRALGNLQAGRTASVTVKRGEQELTFEVKL